MMTDSEIEKMRQLQLDNRVLKKYTEDLRIEIDKLKNELQHTKNELMFAKETHYLNRGTNLRHIRLRD